MAIEMSKERALELYAGGIDCSQVVFGYGAQILGFDEETARKIAGGFGGGMFAGERCGCVTGALMALGLAYGQCKPGDEAAKAEMLAKKAEFEEEFKAIHGSLICKELLKYDLTKPEEMQKIQEEGLLQSLCPVLAVTACDILDELL